MIGFEAKGQNVLSRTNLERFWSAFSIGPKAVSSLVNDLKQQYPKMSLKDTFLAMQWLACSKLIV